MRDIEHDPLKEQHEGHPLVICLVHYIVLPWVVRSDTRLRHMVAQLGVVINPMGRHAEGTLNRKGKMVLLQTGK